MSGNRGLTNGARWRAVKARVRAEENRCGLCGGEVDKSLPADHPLAPHVDHIVPLARGGEKYARDNLQLTHRSCNLAKGDGRRKPTIVFAPLKTSRRW